MNHQNDPQNEQSDPTWKLLGNASKKIPSGSFTQDLVRSVRLEATQESIRWWQKPAWKIGLTAAAACVVAMVSLQLSAPSNSRDGAPLAKQSSGQEQNSSSLSSADITIELDELEYRNELLASVTTPAELDDQDLLELLIL